MGPPGGTMKIIEKINPARKKTKGQVRYKPGKNKRPGKIQARENKRPGKTQGRARRKDRQGARTERKGSLWLIKT